MGKAAQIEFDATPAVHREFKDQWESLQVKVEIPPMLDAAALRAAGRAKAKPGGPEKTALTVPGILCPRIVAAPDSSSSPAPPSTSPAAMHEDLANLPNTVSEDII